jgi:DNA-binding NarL/FixJ family response regulator
VGLLLGTLDADLVEAVKEGILRLTPAEYRVLRGWTDGLGAKRIAGSLNCSFRTVEVHLARIRSKCGHYDWMRTVRALSELDADEEVAEYLVRLSRH